MNNNNILAKSNQTLWFNFEKISLPYRKSMRVHSQSFSRSQIIEICFLVLILLEHTFIFILTFHKNSSKRKQREPNQYSLLLPPQSCLYSCLHRSWIRALSFANMCLSCVYFVRLILKHYHPNLVHHSSITFYSLPLNLLQQLLINFNTFHLFILSISVFQYFLRYYRLLKNTYASYFFNGQNLLLTNHTNVALILSGSLALIFAYNFIFYTPKYPHTISLLPLVTFNMILLPLTNLIISSFLLICLYLIYSYKFKLKNIPNEQDQDNVRLIVEKKTCIKCYSQILQENPNLCQDKNYSYRNLYKHFFPQYPFENSRLHLSNSKENNSQTEFSYEEPHDLENTLFSRTTFSQLNQQHSLCHLCYCLLFIFLFKYILLTFPQYILQMLFHLKQFYQFILKKNLSTNLSWSLYENNEFNIRICHYLFLLSRVGDSFLLIRLSYLFKKYSPCWCQFNSKFLRQQQLSQQILTIKTSLSSNNDGASPGDISNSNDLPSDLHEQESINKTQWKKKHRRYRLRFQFVPLWSNERRKSVKRNV